MVTHIDVVTNKGKVIVDEKLDRWYRAFVSCVGYGHGPREGELNTFEDLSIEDHVRSTLIGSRAESRVPIGKGELHIETTFRMSLQDDSAEFYLSRGAEVTIPRNDFRRGMTLRKFRIGRRRAPATLVVSNRSE